MTTWQLFIILQFLWSFVWEGLSWVVLALGLSWGCNQDVNWGCGHLKAWLGLEALLLDGSLSWLWTEGLCRKPYLLATWTSLCGYLSDLMTLHLASPRRSNQRERERKRKQGGILNAFSDLVSEVIHHHLHHILLVKIKSLSPAHVQREGVSLHLLKGGVSKSL